MVNNEKGLIEKRWLRNSGVANDGNAATTLTLSNIEITLDAKRGVQGRPGCTD